MTRISQGNLTHVTSRDGTPIGYFTSGGGPPLLLVHGGLGDHTRWEALLPHLEPHVTVHAMDRRGRGASGDAADYHVAREFEDVAAVIDAIAADSGSDVDVYCSSFGGLCAFGAAALTPSIGRLALYEGWPQPDPDAVFPAEVAVDDIERHISELLERGEREEALATFYRELLRLSPEEIADLRARPSWPERVAAIHTIPREMRAFRAAIFDPEQAARITVPTLLVVGSETPSWSHQAEIVGAALPDARIEVLEGQRHTADLFAPDIVSERLLAFLQGSS